MKKLLAALLLVVAAPPLVMTFGSAYLTPLCDNIDPAPPYDVAVVLSAGLRDDTVDSTPGFSSAARTETGVALYQEGSVNRLHLTGAASYRPNVAISWGMRDLALAEGVPAEAITIEDRSQSTLQNALFSKPQLENADRILLVTSGYHLWRGALSMAWAGVPVQGMCKSSAFDGLPPALLAEVIVTEIPKWWVNFGRALTWSAASGIGLQDRLPPWFLD